MKHIDLSMCSPDIYLPITQGVPMVIVDNFFKRLWKFSTFRRKFKVREDYCLWVPKLGTWIFVPKYFVYDGASIPKILNSLYSPTGVLLLGALPHDFGYRYEGLFHVDHRGGLYFVSYNKKQLDSIFDTLCEYESGMGKASAIATVTLSVAGFLGWRENRKKNCNLREDFPELFVQEEHYEIRDCA